jgi:hypothetical protein
MEHQMPRLESNNPTERISRVINEYETWIKEYDRLWEAVRYMEGGALMLMDFQRPRAEEFIREKEFLHSSQRRTRFNRTTMRAKRIIRDELEAARPQPLDNLANYRKAAQYAIDNGYCLQGEAPYTNIEMLIMILEGVGIQTFLSTVRGPNNKKIPINELNLEYD